MTLLEMSALYAESAAALRRRIGELRQAARELKDEEDISSSVMAPPPFPAPGGREPAPPGRTPGGRPHIRCCRCSTSSPLPL